MRAMDRVLRCECGFEARAADEERLAARIRRHAWEAHGMTLSDEDALVLALRSAGAAPARGPSTHDNERHGEER
jgi:predicted small metal-binding protein